MRPLPRPGDALWPQHAAAAASEGVCPLCRGPLGEVPAQMKDPPDGAFYCLLWNVLWWADGRVETCEDLFQRGALS